MAQRILLVDDEPGVRTIIARMLDDEGYAVTEVDNALDALDAVRRASPPFDLVITDNRMPGMSGAHLIDELQVERPELPVAMLTGMPVVESLPRGGRIRVLTKPVMPERLLAAIHELIGEDLSWRARLRRWPGASAH